VFSALKRRARAGRLTRRRARTCDDLVPVISAMDWLTDEDKRKIFHDNPAKVCPALAKA